MPSIPRWIPYAALFVVAAGALLWLGRIEIRVTGGGDGAELWAGEAHLPVTVISRSADIPRSAKSAALGRQLDPAAFVHIPGYTLPGKVKGLSPITAYKLTVETGLYAQRFGRDWFVNGSTPAAVLETEDEVTQEQAKVIKDRFKKAAKGREPVALGLGVTYKPISVPETSGP